MKRFVPLKDFWSDETKSQYITGMNYAVLPELQAFLIDKWNREGLIETMDEHPRSMIKGTAE